MQHRPILAFYNGLTQFLVDLCGDFIDEVGGVGVEEGNALLPLPLYHDLPQHRALLADQLGSEIILSELRRRLREDVAI